MQPLFHSVQLSVQSTRVQTLEAHGICSHSFSGPLHLTGDLWDLLSHEGFTGQRDMSPSRVIRLQEDA